MLFKNYNIPGVKCLACNGTHICCKQVDNTPVIWPMPSIKRPSSSEELIIETKENMMNSDPLLADALEQMKENELCNIEKKGVAILTLDEYNAEMHNKSLKKLECLDTKKQYCFKCGETTHKSDDCQYNTLKNDMVA